MTATLGLVAIGGHIVLAELGSGQDWSRASVASEPIDYSIFKAHWQLVVWPGA